MGSDYSKELEDLCNDAAADSVFEKTGAFIIADFFRTKLKKSSYILTSANWKLTKEWALKVLEDEEYSHISVNDWVECIKWSFSDDRYNDPFWGTVKFTSFRTVVKAYDEFNTRRKIKEAKGKNRLSRLDGYGRR